MLKQPDHFGPRLFRSSAIPEAHRFAAWHEVVNSWLLGVEANPVSDAPFHVSGCLRALPELRYGWGTFGGTVNKRTRSLVSQDNDDLFLFVNSAGVFGASQRGRETESLLRPDRQDTYQRNSLLCEPRRRLQSDTRCLKTQSRPRDS